MESGTGNVGAGDACRRGLYGKFRDGLLGAIGYTCTCTVFITSTRTLMWKMRSVHHRQQVHVHVCMCVQTYLRRPQPHMPCAMKRSCPLSSKRAVDRRSADTNTSGTHQRHRRLRTHQSWCRKSSPTRYIVLYMYRASDYLSQSPFSFISLTSSIHLSLSARSI